MDTPMSNDNMTSADHPVPTVENGDETHIDNSQGGGGTTTSRENQSVDVSDQSLLTRCQPNDNGHIGGRLRPQDRSSAPPESLRVLGQQEVVKLNNYLDRFSADIVPPPSMPVYLQILTYLQRWGLWAAHIQNEERRKELIDAIAAKMENVWLVGMEQGHIPQKLDQVNAQSEGKDAGQRGAGTRAQHHRSRRTISPSRKIVIKATAKGRPRYPVTVGELEEAGLSVKEVEQRLLTTELSEQSLLPHLDRVISERDWYGVLEDTTWNPIGRDLEIYCLWEMQSLRRELQTLQELKQRFKSASQVKNTQIRIDAAKALNDQYAAVASLLHEKKGCRLENASPESSETDSGCPDPAPVPATEDDDGASSEEEAETPHPGPRELKLRFVRPQPCRRVITLKTRPEFQPEEYSSRTVNKVRGFRWRYVSSSTLAQRACMDEVIANYIDGRIHNTSSEDIPARFGLYQVLSLPTDPAAGE
ncbi:hypothetical protein DV738_g166, partial [Chaetothyriales sp. CBS 135597]